MSSTTQRRGGLVVAFFDSLPRLLRRPGPELVDGAVELERAYQIYQLVRPLPRNSQARCLWHVDQILRENESRIEAFYRVDNGPSHGSFRTRCRLRRAPPLRTVALARDRKAVA